LSSLRRHLDTSTVVAIGVVVGDGGDSRGRSFRTGSWFGRFGCRRPVALLWWLLLVRTAVVGIPIPIRICIRIYIRIRICIRIRNIAYWFCSTGTRIRIPGCAEVWCRGCYRRCLQIRWLPNRRLLLLLLLLLYNALTVAGEMVRNLGGVSFSSRRERRPAVVAVIIIIIIILIAASVAIRHGK
jgi:hypothetical protein